MKTDTLTMLQELTLFFHFPKKIELLTTLIAEMLTLTMTTIVTDQPFDGFTAQNLQMMS